MVILTLAACGTPRGPAPVVYHGDEPLGPSADLDNDIVPSAAPTQSIESQSLEPLEPAEPLPSADQPSVSYKARPSFPENRASVDRPSIDRPSIDQPSGERSSIQRPSAKRPSLDLPARQMAEVPFDAQAAAARNTASNAGRSLKAASKIAKTGGKIGRKALNHRQKASQKNTPRGNEPPRSAMQREVVPAKVRPASVKVGKGDTLFAISEKYQIALKPLIAVNKLKPPYALKAGQTLKLPPPLHYRVRAGDTVMGIARRFSLDFRSLALINGIQPPYALRANELLILPSLVRGADGKWKSAAASRKPSGSGRKATTRSNAKPARVQAPAKTSTFVWPLKGPVVSSFGAKPGGTRNDGINIAAPAGTAVRAAGSGTVVYAGAELKSFGNLILIRHPNGWVSAYAHNRKLLVKEGAKIKTGDTIAEVGATGSVSTPQLHFETRRGRDPVNPLQHLPKKS